ncbi:MAG TPA: M28 family peptidase [Nocardioides sp.]|nr:M28 family peptidase [Nocardioides sp.]
MLRAGVASLLAALLLAGCTDDGEAPVAEPPAQTPPSPTDPPASTTPSAPTTSPESTPPPRPVSPDDARVRIALDAIDQLAGRIGPRPGTSPAYFRAADWVEQQLRGSGWEVRRQAFPTPAGVSWGIPVPGGRSVNVVATRGDVRPGKPWLLVGAHLDTVPQAPGAEDNASGVGVLLTVADALAERRSRLPVMLVAFGSEEPRGPTDDDHHYGSRAFVAAMTTAQRGSLRGMVSMDRVGVGSTLPIGTSAQPSWLRAELVRAAERAGVDYVAETGQRSSDHWSFVREGMAGVRLGSTPYAGYHSPGDVPSVIDRAQLERTARTVLEWLAP